MMCSITAQPWCSPPELTSGAAPRLLGTLALMRCVASSPAAAAQTLHTRSGLEDETAVEELEDRIFDGAADSLSRMTSASHSQ
jgi:hypothetical protein